MRMRRNVRRASALLGNQPVPKKKQQALPPQLEQLSFGRAEWEAITGLPLKTCDELVRLNELPSFMVGRRRCFLIEDVRRYLRKLRRTGRNPDPRTRMDALKAKP
jgi:excisionase family DNA binding protein